jgi:hypothetical protein
MTAAAVTVSVQSEFESRDQVQTVRAPAAAAAAAACLGLRLSDRKLAIVEQAGCDSCDFLAGQFSLTIVKG